jgi:hypothetical protein
MGLPGSGSIVSPCATVSSSSSFQDDSRPSTVALVGFILDERFTEPAIDESWWSPPDGYVLAQHEG